MSSPPATIPATATVGEAIRTMAEGGYRHLPMVDDEGRPTGVVAVHGIVHYLVDHFPATVYNLPPNPNDSHEGARRGVSAPLCRPFGADSNRTHEYRQAGKPPVLLAQSIHLSDDESSSTIPIGPASSPTHRVPRRNCSPRCPRPLPQLPPLQKSVQNIDEATVRFCGDSGDGMQLAGTQFTNTSALAGNDIATFPDFPAEIRAPRGTKAGVSRLSDPLLQQRHLHARRHGRRAGGDEPRRAGDQPRRPPRRRHPDRQQGRLRHEGPGAGRLQDQPARRRQPQVSTSVLHGRHDQAHAAGRRRAWA